MKYKEITTLSRPPAASQASELLEQAGIPVLVEHVQIDRGPAAQVGYRVLVPQDCSQSALRVINRLRDRSF